jgi:hypothetical protein
MVATLRLMMLIALCASLITIVMPSRTPAAIPSPKAECCAHMQMDGEQSDCSHHAPKTNQDRQCCSGCAVCLSLFLNAKTPFLFPPSAGELLAIASARNIVRTQQPPVPPPRFTLV